MHALRSSPCFSASELSEIDGQLRSCLSQSFNVCLSDSQWLQASLPVKNGGLGIRSTVQLAPSAFLASANATSLLQKKILSHCPMEGDTDTHVSKAEKVWQSFTNATAPAGSAASRQKSWDDPVVISSYQKLLTDNWAAHDRARILAVSAPKSSDWLHALPISSCGLRLDDETVRVAIGLRLGAKLCEPHKCICGEEVDPLGHHGLSCKRSSGRSSRHLNLNDIIWRALARADIPAVKEPAGLSRSDGKRPDGLTQIPWSLGKCLIWDVTVVDSVAKSYLDSTSISAGAAAEIAALRKTEKYCHLAERYTFVPIAVETLGPLCQEGSAFLSQLGRLISSATGDSREQSFLMQRISIAIQRFNAVCFRGTFDPASSCFTTI